MNLIRCSASCGAVTSDSFCLAQDNRAARAVRVLDRNDSHRFWFTSLPAHLKTDTALIAYWQRPFHPATLQLPGFSSVSETFSRIRRRIRTSVVELHLGDTTGKNFVWQFKSGFLFDIVVAKFSAIEVRRPQAGAEKEKDE